MIYCLQCIQSCSCSCYINCCSCSYYL